MYLQQYKNSIFKAHMNKYLITKGKGKIKGDPVTVVLQLTTYHLSCAKLVCLCPRPNATVKRNIFTQTTSTALLR